jgi:hypothetical protein
LFRRQKVVPAATISSDRPEANTKDFPDLRPTTDRVCFGACGDRALLFDAVIGILSDGKEFGGVISPTA